MKGYYVHFNARDILGVNYKVEMQIAELKKYFDVEEIDIGQNERSLIRKVYELNPYITGKKHNLEAAYQRIEKPDFLYVRAIWCDNQYISFFKTIREKYPKCKIIVEIPTYPYDKNLEKKLYLRDIYSRRKYKKYIDVFATYSNHEEIFGVPTINVENGIAVDKIKKVSGELEPNVIRLIVVANMLKNHGYERVLNGLGDYYDKGGNRHIEIHMAGDGPELPYYKEIVKKRGLQGNVIFYGKKIGEELDCLYDKADIALTSFGFYKIDVFRMSALKTRECLAKGLPMVNGCTIDIFEKEPYKYSLDFPNDASIVDMQKIVDFYDKIYSGKKKADVVAEIREMAYKKADISVAMKPVVRYILCEERG